MNLFNKLKATIINHIETPKGFKKGETFEQYIENKIFTPDNYKIVEKTHNYITNKKNYVEASTKPDFKFRDKINKEEFYIEAKFRKKDFKGKYEWCTIQQLKRYQEHHKEKPVFILLGIGGTPLYPEELFLIPLKDAKYTGLFPKSIEKFKIEIDEKIESKRLWKY